MLCPPPRSTWLVAVHHLVWVGFCSCGGLPGYIWAWPFMGLPGANQAPGLVQKGPFAHLASTLDPLWCIYILMGALPLLCLVVPRRANSTLCWPWQVSFPLASKWWLKILLHLLEEGMWSLGGSCAAPRQSSMVQGGPHVDLPEIISFLPATWFVFQCPPAWAFSLFRRAAVLNE